MLKQRTNIPEKEQRRYTTDIQDRIHNTIADLDELDDTIKIVQGNPARFKIEKREMDDRKAFVNTTRRLVEVHGD
jgi:Mg2+ and Co2+ transporter CorA